MPSADVPQKDSRIDSITSDIAQFTGILQINFLKKLDGMIPSVFALFAITDRMIKDVPVSSHHIVHHLTVQCLFPSDICVCIYI